MTLTFAVNWDYRCPFARNAHEHVIEGLRAGADWEVTFAAFSLSQMHIDEGEPPVWDDPGHASVLLPMEAAIVVRDRMPAQFLDVHHGLFTARHQNGRDLRDRGVVTAILEENGVDAGAVLGEVDSGSALERFRAEHEEWAGARRAFGVPTFAVDGATAFVRLTSRPDGDATKAIQSIERVVGLLSDCPDLNEFKHTSISR